MTSRLVTSAPPPRVGFVIGGVQKGGTTALARFLERHPGVVLPVDKEAHVFDAPAFDDRWDVAAVDRRYASRFPADARADALHGDATPLYVFHPRLVERIARYNPDMKWILILRHPVERAVSHHAMERGRGYERLPLWAAMLLEGWRLRGQRADDLSAGSPLRRYSYRTRGDYAAQLDALYARFPPSQVLVLRNDELAAAPAEVIRRVHRFLGVPELPGDGEYGRVFEGSYRPLRRDGPGWRFMCWLMRRELADARTRYGIDWS